MTSKGQGQTLKTLKSNIGMVFPGGAVAVVGAVSQSVIH